MKNSICTFMHLSKVQKKIYVALDANVIELKEFGITKEQLNEMADEIEKIFQKILTKDK